jgi:SAM-dependent methyltransferase
MTEAIAHGSAEAPVAATPESAVEIVPVAPAIIPWWLRIAVKTLLSRIPLPHHWWRRLGVFRHGRLVDDIERRSNGFLTHSAIYRNLTAAPLRQIIELGPGDSVATALFAHGFGAERIWLIDVGRFAVDAPAHYRAALDRLSARGGNPPQLARPEGIDAVLAATNATYLTDGIDAMGTIPDDSIDLLFSLAVLEHIRRAAFDRLLDEIFRVLRPGGVSTHLVDLRDHLGGGLNNLRFSQRLWEHPIMASSGFYTNRLRCTEICEKALARDFRVSIAMPGRWAAPPTPRRVLSAEFRDLSDDELAVAWFTLILQKPESRPGAKP